MSNPMTSSFGRTGDLLLNLLLIVMIGGLAGCKQKETEGATEEVEPTTPVPVRAAVAKIETLQPSIDLVGVLEAIPERVAILTAQVAGQVRSISVVEGQTVHKNDVILQLDDRSAEAQRAKVRASVEEAQAVLARLKRGPRPEEIEAARQDARKAETVVQAMRLRSDAMKDLHEKQEMADVQYARVRAELQAAEAEYAAFNARLKLLEAGTRPEAIAEAEAKLAAAQADLATADLTVQLHRLTSPFDGVVTELAARQGMSIDPLTRLGILADLSTLFARVQIPSAYLSGVRAGAIVDVRATALTGHVFKGAVSRLGKQADPRTGNVDAFASVPNDTGDLRPGLACQVRVWLPAIPDALVIPVAAIADRDGTPVVTAIRDNKAYETEVVLGVQTRERAQIMKGLSLGDLVAVQGGYGLPEGCPCIVTVETDNESKPTTTAKTPGG